MSSNLNIRVPDGYLERVDAKAQGYGMNRTEFVLNAIDMMMSFDEVFIKKIQHYSRGLHIPEWLVMQNMIIKRMADEAAEGKVYGGGTRLLDEFMLVGDGEERRSITGGELFDILKKQYITKYEQKLVNQAVREEACGAPLSEKEKELMIKYRRGRVWLESEERKEELERDARYHEFLKEIEEKYPEAASKQAGYFEQMKADLKAARSEHDPDETVTPEELDKWTKE